MFEHLEHRFLRDATFHAQSGVVDVEGTRHPDIITCSLITVDGVAQIDITTNGRVQNFKLKSVAAVHFNGGAGADSINAEGIGVRCTLDGGKGDDTLIGSSRADKLIAGGGRNSLDGAGGNDILIAGLQADSIDGAGGDDRIIPDNTATADDTLGGGSGFDVVDYSHSPIRVIALVGGSPKASQANDVIRSDIEQILGSDLNDTLSNSTKHGLQIFGRDGNDTLTGGSGGDTLDGGAGNDSLVGLGGRDHFRSKDGRPDTIDGGHGVDFVEDSDTLIVKDVITNVP